MPLNLYLQFGIYCENILSYVYLPSFTYVQNTLMYSCALELRIDSYHGSE